VFLKWAAHANKHAKEEKENTTFSANFHGALLKCYRDFITIYQGFYCIVKVVLQKKKKKFKGGF